MTPQNNKDCEKSEKELLEEAATDLKRIIAELQRNANRLQYKIDEIRTRRIHDDAT